MIFPHSRPAAHVVLLLVLTALLPSGQPFAETDQRVIGIGDIHGAYDELTALLQEAQLTDDQQRWSGGRTILVQTGDIIDRGANIRGVLDLLMSLEPQADAAGGKVIALLGNHETMNLMGNLRDVAPGAFASFADDKSEERREQAYQDYVEYHAERVEALGRPLPDVQTREQWMASHPLGFVQYVEAFGPKGRYGRWLRSKDVVTQVGDTIFLHGGIHPNMPPKLKEINDRAKREIGMFDEYQRHLVDRKVILPYSTFQEILTAARLELEAWVERLWPGPPAPGRDPVSLERRDRQHLEILLHLRGLGTWSVVDANGPVWFRGFAQWSSEEGRQHVADLLDRYDASRLVVGHTIPATKRIMPRFDSRVFLIDTGMLSNHYRGHPSALVLEGDRVTAVYLDERVVLVGPARTPPH